MTRDDLKKDLDTIRNKLENKLHYERSFGLDGIYKVNVQQSLDEFQRTIADCPKCKALVENRTQVVFGDGNPRAELMFVGEAPGRDEDIQGIPFVGRAGQLLTKIIKAMGLERKDVYIANIIKCRPPGNRLPNPQEVANCLPYLKKQIALIKPKIICALGSCAIQSLLDTKTPISKIRGQFIAYNNIYVVPTFHPAYLLRNPNAKRHVWEDVQKVRDYLLGKLNPEGNAS